MATSTVEEGHFQQGWNLLLEFRGSGFRGLGFRGLGFRGLGFRGSGFRAHRV